MRSQTGLGRVAGLLHPSLPASEYLRPRPPNLSPEEPAMDGGGGWWLECDTARAWEKPPRRLVERSTRLRHAATAAGEGGS
jgi:hypothetical protein